MNEEILVKLGIDARPVAGALRGIKGQLSDWKDTVISNFKGIGASMAAAFSVGGIAVAIKSVVDYAGRLADLSEVTGQTTDLIQGFSHAVEQNAGTAQAAERGLEKLNVKIGEARNGVEAAIDAFDRYDINLKHTNGTNKSAEEILKDVSDRMAGIKDPTQRAAMAVEFFGKAGASLVPALAGGRAELEKFMASAQKMSREDIAAIDTLNDKIAEMSRNVQVQGGTVIGFWSGLTMKLGKVWEVAKPLFQFGGLLRHTINVSQEWGAASVPGDKSPITTTGSPRGKNARVPTKQEVEQAIQLQQRYAQLMRKMSLDSMTDEQRLQVLDREALADKAKAETMDQKSNEYLKFQVERAEKLVAITELAQKIDKDRLENYKKLTEEVEKQVRAAEHQRDVLNSINAAAEERFQANRSLETALGDQSKFTLQDLAGVEIDRNTTGDMRQQILMARQIIQAQGYARNLAAHGFETEAQGVLGRIDKVRSGMTALTESERFPFQPMIDRLDSVDKHLDDLVRKAEGEGLHIVPVMGK